MHPSAERASAQPPKGVAQINLPALPAGGPGGGRTGGATAPPGALSRLLPTGTAQLAREREWSATVSRNPVTHRVVACVAGSGGVGTSTVAAGLALTVAALRPGEVALAGAGTGAASLGLRVAGVTAPSAAQFATGTAEPLRSSGLSVVDGAPWDTPLTRPTLVRLITDLREDCAFAVLDVGNDAGETGHGALARVDGVVVVTTDAPDAMASAERTLARVRDIDPARARDAVAAVVALRRRRRRVTPQTLLARTVNVPWDPGLDGGAPLHIDGLRPRTRAAFLELAAALFAGTDGGSR